MSIIPDFDKLEKNQIEQLSPSPGSLIEPLETHPGT
jgi:hypothetical protein